MKLKYIFITLQFLLAFVIADNEALQDACTQCHYDIDDDLDKPVMTNITEDIHFQVGLGCSDCHGGNPEAFDDSETAMWDDETFIGAIDKIDQPEVCGSCHSDPSFMRNYSTSIRTDQVNQYWTSRHGSLLKQGDTKVAACTNCHGVHGILPADHPLSKVYPTEVPNTCATCHSNADYMNEYNIPTNQLEKYLQSVHGITLIEKQDLYSPACNDCHGNHGAVPPNIAHISDICGSCHINNKTLFQGSFHREIFIENDINECEACHGNHAVMPTNDEMLYWGEHSICMNCHDEDDDYAMDLSMGFYNTIDSLKSGLISAEKLINTAEQKGMEISELFVHLEEARKILIQTRTNIHGFDLENLNKIAEEGFLSIHQAQLGGLKALEESDFRRKGLFVFSIILAITTILLYFKLNEMKRRSKK